MLATSVSPEKHAKLGVVLRVVRGSPSNREVLLIKRTKEPYAGFWALPGGGVEHGERVEDAARRELAEETGLEATRLVVKGVREFIEGSWHRFHILVDVPSFDGEPQAGDDAGDIGWLPLADVVTSLDVTDYAKACLAQMVNPLHLEVGYNAK